MYTYTYIYIYIYIYTCLFVISHEFTFSHILHYMARVLTCAAVSGDPRGRRVHASWASALYQKHKHNLQLTKILIFATHKDI